MRNDKFWDEAKDGSIRRKIAEFIDSNPAVSHLKDEKYYAFEDAMVAFIEKNRDMISKEVDAEYQREDFLSQAKEEFGDAIEEAVKVLPLEIIDDMISHWQKALNEDDDYWQITWDLLTEVLTDSGISPLVGIDNCPTEDILIYAAYLKEWYTDVPKEMQGEMPACIDEFFANEMEDEQLSEYYIKAAKKLFGDKITRK